MTLYCLSWVSLPVYSKLSLRQINFFELRLNSSNSCSSSVSLDRSILKATLSSLLTTSNRLAKDLPCRSRIVSRNVPQLAKLWSESWTCDYSGVMNGESCVIGPHSIATSLCLSVQLLQQRSIWVKKSLKCVLLSGSSFKVDKSVRNSFQFKFLGNKNFVRCHFPMFYHFTYPEESVS